MSPSNPSPGFTPYQPGDHGLGVKGKRIPPIVTKAGKKAYQIEYEARQRGPGGTNVGMAFRVPAFLPAEQLRVRFKVYYPQDYPWGPEMKKTAGKIFGFQIGEGESSGGKYSTTGATFRVTWNLNGGAGPYLYPQLKRDHGGTPTWSQLDQTDEIKRIAGGGDISGVAMHLWYPEDKNDKWTFKLEKERWNEIEMFCKLNTPGKYDGVLELAINGVRRRTDAFRYRYDKSKINELIFSTFFGGGNLDYAPPRATNAWYADFEVSKT
jgi:hypothetical protein